MVALESHGSLHTFTPSTSTWSTIGPTDPSLPHPAARSYHALTSDANSTLYLHAGCPSPGRLSDLWSFHLPSGSWKQLASAPGLERGATSVALAAAKPRRTK